MATKTKSGSLAKLIQRAKEAQEGTLTPTDSVEAPVVDEAAAPEPTPVPVAEVAPPAPKVVAKKPTARKAAPKKAAAKKPAAKKKPTVKESAPAKPEPVQDAVPELAADRRLGRRGNPNYRQANAYIPKALHLKVKLALLEDGDREFSSLVEELLETWLEQRA